MNGQMMSYNPQKYKESLLKTPDPVAFDQLPKIKMNLAGLSKYALKKGVKISELSDEEKKQFIGL